MFNFLKPRSPLHDEQRRWIDERFGWLLRSFGEERLSGPVITPTDQFFPDRYSATQEDATHLFARVCSYMHVDSRRIDLQFYDSAAADVVAAAYFPPLQEGYALGVFNESDGQITIWIERSDFDKPESLIGTMAHELGHVHLLADGRCTATLEDHEPLTDLLTVFWGFGVFTANSVVRESNWKSGNMHGWSLSRRGYLRMPELAYALAVYADIRGESRPAWTAHLRRDVRSLLMVELTSLQTEPESCRGTGLDRLRRRIEQSKGSSQPIVLTTAAETPGALTSDPLDDNSETEAADRDESDENASADDLFSLGIYYIREGDYHAALDALTRSLEVNPDDAETWLHRGDAHRGLSGFAEAVEDYTRALDLDPDIDGAHRGRASAQAWLRQYDSAIRDVGIALRIDKRDAESHYIRAMSLFGLGDLKGALSSANSAIRYAPTWGELYLARGRIYLSMNNDRKASADMSEAIRRDSALNDPAVREQTLAARELI